MPTLTPPVTGKQVAVTTIEHIYQSQASPTNHYTYNDMLEGLRCCEIVESIQTYSILVLNIGFYWSQNCHPGLKSRGVVMVVDKNEFKSQPCTTIHDTYNEQLERLRCCELPKSVQTHTILVWKVDKGQIRFVPTHDPKTCCGDHFRAHIPTSAFSNQSLYL